MTKNWQPFLYHRKIACKSVFSATPSNLTFDTLQFHLLFLLLFCTNSTRNFAHFTEKLLVKRFFAAPLRPFDTLQFHMFFLLFDFAHQKPFPATVCTWKDGRTTYIFQSKSKEKMRFLLSFAIYYPIKQ